MTGPTAQPHRLLCAVFALLVTVHLASAQQTLKPAGENQSPTASETQAGNNFHSSFASAEFALDARTIVRGAPFSAVGTKETTQTLRDGRTLVRRMTTSIYRDSEGRTRLEWGNSTKARDGSRVPMIYDAVTGASYILGGRRPFQIPTLGKDGPPARQAKIITPQSPPDDIKQAIGETIEPLGTKTIEGVTVEGVRITTTIPAAELVGRQPGKVIFERWYSQELRRNVLIKVIDPRFGEALYQLTNIDRREPPRELFVIPTETAPESKSDSAVERDDEGRVSVKFERGARVAVDNRTTGKIVVIGWDKDFVEARATSERGTEAVRYSVSENPFGKFAAGDGAPGKFPAVEMKPGKRIAKLGKRIWLKGDYSNREELAAASSLSPTPQPPPEPAPIVNAPPPLSPIGPMILPRPIRMPEGKYDSPVDPPMRDGSPIEVSLEVRVPRYAEIELIKVNRSRVEITGVETPLTILGNRGDVVLRDVGNAEVRTQSGTIDVEGATGLVDVITSSGPVRVRRAGGDVRALSISGDVEIECVRGRVNVDSTSGIIKLTNIQGDVVATTSASNLSLAGAIREDGRYHLKTMSGTIEMSVRDKPLPGFTAVLSSYRGQIENDFQLHVNRTTEHEISRTTELDISRTTELDRDDVNRRVIGRHGNGRAQITLDSFDGKVRLARAAPDTAKECK